MSDAVENSELRGRLLGVKLRALVGDHLGVPVDAEPLGFRSGAGLVVDGVAWVIIDGDAERSLGPALAWAIRHDASSLALIAESSTGLLARRATLFEFPIAVWFAEDRTLLPVIAEEIVSSADALPAHLELAAMIEQAGAEPCVEHGVVTGEVRGLEVCRVVDQPTIGRLIELGEIDLSASRFDDLDGGVILEVGVGANDREAFHLIHGDVPTPKALADVVASVAAHRTTDAPQHPLNRMAHERYLLWRARQEPAAVGMASVESAPPPVPRPSMKDVAPAAAIGIDAEGTNHLLVFTSGVDLDVVPFALDAHAALSLATPLLASQITIAARSNDLVSITREIAAQAGQPIRVAEL